MTYITLAIFVGINVICKRSGFCSADGTGSLLCAGRVAVTVGSKLTRFGTAIGAGSLLCAGCFAVTVGSKLTRFGTAIGAGSFLCAGCFAEGVFLHFTVEGVAVCTDGFLQAGCLAAGALCCLFVFCVARAYSCVSAVTVGHPSSKAMLVGNGNVQFVLRFKVLFFVEKCVTNRTPVMCFHARVCAIGFGCLN